MNFKKDLSGNVYYNLKVLAFNYNTKKWVCQCKCGNILEVETTLLTSGRKKSCGCQRYIRKKNKDGNYPRLKKMYDKILFKKEGNWKDWEDFKEWALNNKYKEILSYKKIKRKQPYSKDNLMFGIKYNSKFLSIKDIKKHHIFWDKDEECFYIRFKYNNTTITKRNIYTINDLCEEHIKLYHRYFHKKSFFE